MSVKFLIVCSLPLLIMIDIMAFTMITTMLRAASDTYVFYGVLGICALIAINYFPVKYAVALVKEMFNKKS